MPPADIHHRAIEPSQLRVAPGIGLASMLVAACLPRLPVPSPPRDEPTAERAYDFRSKTRIGGEILTIDDVRSNDAAFSGLHMMMRAERGLISVHLGPRAFFDYNAIAFKVGDRLDITGIPTTYEGNPALVATALNRGDPPLRLPLGIPGDADGGAFVR